MTTFVRPAAVAREDADMIAGWNISPNTGYQLQISATASGAVVILLSVDGSTLIGSGVADVGTAQPVTITPMSGQTVDMAALAIGWHMLLTTDGTEGDRIITLDPMVDLPARTHPVYADDDLALAVAAQQGSEPSRQAGGPATCNALIDGQLCGGTLVRASVCPRCALGKQGVVATLTCDVCGHVSAIMRGES